MEQVQREPEADRGGGPSAFPPGFFEALVNWSEENPDVVINFDFTDEGVDVRFSKENEDDERT